MAGEPTFEPAINPSFDIEDDRNPRLRSNDFGDGYSQRARDGLNHDPSNIGLNWTNITAAEAAPIWTFLTARGGDEAFFWDVPTLPTGLKWTCPKYNKRTVSPDVVVITISLKQCFDP